MNNWEPEPPGEKLELTQDVVLFVEPSHDREGYDWRLLIRIHGWLEWIDDGSAPSLEAAKRAAMDSLHHRAKQLIRAWEKVRRDLEKKEGDNDELRKV